jgi:hypothetical protein
MANGQGMASGAPEGPVERVVEGRTDMLARTSVQADAVVGKGVAETGNAAKNVLDDFTLVEITMFRKATGLPASYTVSIMDDGKFLVVKPGQRKGISYTDVYSNVPPYAIIPHRSEKHSSEG